MSGIDDIEGALRRLSDAVSRVERAAEARERSEDERAARAREELALAAEEGERSRALVDDMSGRLEAAIARLSAVVEG